LNEADGEQQPGIYTVETEEEPLDVMKIAAYRRVSIVMNRYDLHGPGGFTRFVTIDPAELDAALARDAMPGLARDTGIDTFQLRHSHGKAFSDGLEITPEQLDFGRGTPKCDRPAL
jgi:hypothetical protein